MKTKLDDYAAAEGENIVEAAKSTAAKEPENFEADDPRQSSTHNFDGGERED